MSKPRKQDGVVYSRKDGRILWIRYRDRNGKPCRESTQTEDWQEADRKLRERLLARDGNLLEAIRKGESLGFREWVLFSRTIRGRPYVPIKPTKRICAAQSI
jgi:hypothetical protein